MPSSVLLYWLSVYVSLCLTVSSLYVPLMKTPGRRTRQHTYSTLDASMSGTANTQWNKRASVYSVFSRMMTRHASRHKNDKAFVDKMFNLFDLNGNRVIERMEFKAVLQILGIVSHNI